MTPREESRIAEWQQRSDHPVSLTLLKTDAPRTAEFEAFAEALRRLAPRVSVKTDREDAPGSLPGFRLENGVAFHIIPLGRELAPFLTALDFGGPGGPAPPDGAAERLAVLRAPVELRLYVALACPHCPMVLRSVLDIVAASDRIGLSVIDGSLFPDRAAADDIQAVPTLFLEKKRWTGQVRPEEILDALAGVDPADMSPATMERMIAEGNAGELASLMGAEGRIFPSLLNVATHESWAVRLGAMVAVETLVEDAPEVAGQLAAPLWDRFETADDTVRGDILYVLGLVGGPEDMVRLRRIAEEHPSEALREAAAEAAEEMAERL